MLMILNFTYPSHSLTFLLTSHLQDTRPISKTSTGMSSNLLSLNQSKTEFLLMGLPKQLSKITHPILQMSSDISVSSVASARNLGIIFDSTLSMSAEAQILQCPRCPDTPRFWPC